jgi:starvation-inducible DNA-binding protein
MKDAYLSSVNKYISELAVFNVKIHNVHWNMVGHPFIMFHKYTETLYTSVFEMYDQMAERARAHGSFPIGNMKKYLELSGLQELPEEPKAVDIWFGLEVLVNDLTYLKKQSINIKELADSNKDHGTSALMDDHILKYEEAVWFLSSSLAKKG